MADTNEIGLGINKRRTELGLSLAELGKKTGLTASFIGQVERDRTGVSIDSLGRIAEALDTSIFQLIQVDQPEMLPELSFVRAGRRSKLTLSDSNVVYEILTPDLTRKMQAHLARITPQDGNICRRLRIQSEELFYIVAGKLMIGFDNQEVVLETGDSGYFESSALTRVACHTDAAETIYICVMTPPAF